MTRVTLSGHRKIIDSVTHRILLMRSICSVRINCSSGMKADETQNPAASRRQTISLWEYRHFPDILPFVPRFFPGSMLLPPASIVRFKARIVRVRKETRKGVKIESPTRVLCTLIALVVIGSSPLRRQTRISLTYFEFPRDFCFNEAAARRGFRERLSIVPIGKSIRCTRRIRRGP